LPEWMRRCRARELESLKGCTHDTLVSTRFLNTLLAYTTAYLSAAFTLVRLLARVNSLMDRQSRPLDKLLAAVGKVADVRPISRVDAF